MQDEAVDHREETGENQDEHHAGNAGPLDRNEETGERDDESVEPGDTEPKDDEAGLCELDADDPTDTEPEGEDEVEDEIEGDVATGCLVIVLALVGALTVLGLVAFWPRGSTPSSAYGPQPGVSYVDATVTGADETGLCELDADDPADAAARCTLFRSRLTSGTFRGDDAEFSFSPTELATPDVAVGDDVVLMEFPGYPPESRYYYYDHQRTWPLVWLVVAFAVAVLAFGRWQGARALAGLAASLVVLAVFIVPALLQESPALPVALVASSLVAFLAIYLAHGFNLASSIALAGTLASLAFTALLALLMASLAHITGLADDNAQLLQVTSSSLDLRGLLVAGIVIGALGAIDDITVSQVSTVAALRRANPALSAARLYQSATRVGRDHVAAAVNTLVLAYAGASLPLLMFFGQGVTPIGRVLTSELVAVEIIRMLVGSIGLVLSVPVTTGLAVAILSRTSADDIAVDDHHHHGHDLPDAVP